MMNLGVSRRDQRTLAVGAATIALLVAGGRGVPALMAWQDRQSAAAESAGSELARVRAGAKLLPVLRESLSVRQTRLAQIDSVLLTGPTPAAIAADLASSLKDLADDTSVRVTGLQLRADSVAVAGLVLAEVRLTGITDVTGLGGFLREVEGGRMPLVVRELTVSQPDPAGSSTKAEALRMDMLVVGIGSIKVAKSDARP